MSKTYIVRCEWDDTGWWVVTILGVPGAFTQSRRLDQVAGDVAEVLSLLTGETSDDYELVVETHLPALVSTDADRARALRLQADRATVAAQEATALAVRQLHDLTRLTYRDIGALLGISHQRAQQLAVVQRSGGASQVSGSVTRGVTRSVLRQRGT